MKDSSKKNETAYSIITRQSHVTAVGDSHIDLTDKSILIRSQRFILESDK